MLQRFINFCLLFASGAGLLHLLLKLPLLGEILQEASEESLVLILCVGVVLSFMKRSRPAPTIRRALLASATVLCLGAGVYQVFRLLPYRLQSNSLMARPGAEAVHFGSFNVLKSSRPTPEALAWLETLDVAVLLEFNQDWDEATRQWAGIRHPSNHYFGIAILSKRPCIEGEEGGIAVDSPLDQNFSGWLRCLLDFNGTLVNVYAVHPSAPIHFSNVLVRRQYMQSLSQRIEADPRPKIIAGDFNSVPWSDNMKEFIGNHKLQSAYETYAAVSTYPVERYLPFVFGLPIDHLLFTSPLQLISFRRLASLGSDHYPIEAELSFQRAN